MNEIQTLRNRIAELRRLSPLHIDLGKRMLTAYDGNLYAMDLLGAAVLNRSIRLVKGFAHLIGDNFMAAAPLVRLQLDNLLRFHAAFLVKDPHGFVMDVLRGSRINKLKGQDGHTLTDAHLVDKLLAKNPEIRGIYDKGCSYIHLSDLHILHAVRSSGGTQLSIAISEEESEVSEEHRLDAVDTMAAVTQLILNHIEGWVHTKANPDLVQEPLRRVRLLLEQRKTDEAKNWLARIISDHPDPAVVREAKRLLASL